MSGKHYPARERRFAPWKNGGGETAEIVCHPEGAGFDDFLWRISTAKVERSGPFSAFPGIDRVLTVIEGGSMDLCFEDGTVLHCTPQSGPHPFAGEAACDAVLHEEGLLDLNLMVRSPLRGAVYQPGEAVPKGPVRGAWLFALSDGEMAKHDLKEVAVPPEVPEGTLLIVVSDGTLQ